MGSMDKLPPYIEGREAPYPARSTSKCRVYAFAILALLIVLDAFTAIIVMDTKVSVRLLQEKIDNISGYPDVSDPNLASDSEPKNSLKPREPEKIFVPTTISPGEINYRRFKPNSRFPYFIDSKMLFSDGKNDETGQFCSDAKPEYGLKNETKIFYTLFKPAKISENPDISSIHLASHQPFQMTPTFSGRLAPNITDFDLENRKTVVYVHGFRSSSYSRSALLEQFFRGTDEYNLILVDWRVLAKSPRDPANTKKSIRTKRSIMGINFENIMFSFGAETLGSYSTAWKHRHLVARELFNLLEIMINQISPDQIHLVGHSLGAHIAGETGFYFSKNTGMKLERITGLDPASLCFDKTDKEAMKKQLTKSKAKFVDVWHTNSNLERKGAGLARPVGHVDFWINGGKFQPICLSENQYYDETLNAELGQGWKESAVGGDGSPCSHAIVDHYFVDSLSRCKGTEYETGFNAYEIDSKKLYDYQHDGNATNELDFEIPSSWFDTSKKMGFFNGKQSFEQFLVKNSTETTTISQIIDLDQESGDDTTIPMLSELGSGTSIIEETSAQKFEKYPSFWEDSINFYVPTKHVRNPNKARSRETKFWSGYCR